MRSEKAIYEACASNQNLPASTQMKMDLNKPTPPSQESRWQQITLFLLSIGVLVVCALILEPFLLAIVGAIVLAIATRRPYNWLTTKIPNRTASAILALILVTLSIIVPSFFLTQSLVQQATHFIHTIRSDSTQQKLTDFLVRHPALAERIETLSDTIDPQNALRSVGAFLGTRFAAVLGHSIGAIIGLIVMLFILFFLYRDRELAITFARSLVPLSDDETTELLERVRSTIFATALGRVAIAGVQGILAGLAFWVLGVPSPVLWGLMTAVASLIPGFGSFLVWTPVAVYLGLTGHWGKAALLGVWGGSVVSTIDNFLYPILIGSQVRQHTVSILLSILGGIALFGPAGLILGPVTFSVAATLLDFWHERNRRIYPAPPPITST
jgi:predicted PurR-regulated permease PerM